MNRLHVLVDAHIFFKIVILSAVILITDVQYAAVGSITDTLSINLDIKFVVSATSSTMVSPMELCLRNSFRRYSLSATAFETVSAIVYEFLVCAVFSMCSMVSHLGARVYRFRKYYKCRNTNVFEISIAVNHHINYFIITDI